MNQHHGIGGAVGMAGARERSILPLPEEVVAQIKSSTAIVSLISVILDLLKNALDAKATKIEVTIDFARGGCSIEDNGLGIPPIEFREEGGLGKLHCTSKYHTQEACLGRNGTFLASLAAMSLLNITSHHHGHRSHNSITFHHSKVIARQLPALAQHEIHGKHGTRVTVRNLFGNMPVRVKQRAMVADQRIEYDRFWESLKREVTCLTLSWRGAVSLRMRASDGKIMFNVNNSKSKTHGVESTELCSAQLQPVLSILTQANHISFDEWSSWVPASASTSNISIKGAISLGPAPSKHVQFISLGIRPLSAEDGHNELYDEVNRLFALSSFGVIENEIDVDTHEKIRRQNDKRYKHDGYTDRQLKSRKGIDRYPMFYLRISLRSSTRASRSSEDQLIDNETNFQAVVDVLDAMITQWLSVHHFRPYKSRARRGRLHTTSTSSSDSEASDASSSMSHPPQSSRVVDRDHIQCENSLLNSARADSRKRKRSAMALGALPDRVQHGSFAEWSRIKSGKSNFFDNVPIRVKRVAEEPEPCIQESLAGTPFDCHIDTILPGALSRPSGHAEAPEDEQELPSVEGSCDNTTSWTDPLTKQTFMLNARTGCVMPQVPARPHSDTLASPGGRTLKDFNKPLCLPPKPATAEEQKRPWLDEVLRNWDNPIFQPAEKSIRQASQQEKQFGNGDYTRSKQFKYSHPDIDKAFEELAASGVSKLSKKGLCDAEVIAQLDNKFILAKMQNSSDLLMDSASKTEVLVLIDQHAADERIRVEALFAELCSPFPDNSKNEGYRSKLGHKSLVVSTLLEKPIQFTVSPQEREHFTTHAARFAVWGILFDILTLNTGLSRRQGFLSVTTLPPSIVERCKADPQLLISLLRSTVWKYAEDPKLRPISSCTSNQPDDGVQHQWVKRLATCPPGLIDLLNSRACRSAIMFNDELTFGQCEELIKHLSECVFPFMCAHGRPSMVPLVELGSIAGEANIGFGLASLRNETDGQRDFVSAWKKWKGK